MPCTEISQVLDLLGGRCKLDTQEDARGRVHLPGLVGVPVHDADEMIDVIRRGEEMRVVGSTSANETSSRSHAVLQVCVSGGVHGRLLLVDLAGSERASDSTSKHQQTRAEGAEINKSLLALKVRMRGLERRHGSAGPPPLTPHH